LLILLAIITAVEPNIISGADLAAWRDMGHDATTVELESFIGDHADSPLAELAYRRLGTPSDTATANIERAITVHNAHLTREATSIAIATLSPELSDTDESRQTPPDSSIADAQ
jgi:hypothetical protein